MKRKEVSGRFRRHEGFTLMELMIALTVGLIILAAIYGTFTVQQKRYNTEEQVSEMQQNARAAMDIMAREIRMAGYDPDKNASASILSAGANSLSFSLDVEIASGTYQTYTITYSLDSGNNRITRAYGASGNQPLAENIQSLAFAYYDASGNVTATASAIREIKITLTARTSGKDPDYSANSGYRTYSLSTMVKPRNLL